MHRDSIIVVGADAGALARLVERMNARPGGFALNLSGGNAWRRGWQWSAEGEAQREISSRRLYYPSER